MKNSLYKAAYYFRKAAEWIIFAAFVIGFVGTFFVLACLLAGSIMKATVFPEMSDWQAFVSGAKIVFVSFCALLAFDFLYSLFRSASEKGEELIKAEKVAEQQSRQPQQRRRVFGILRPYKPEDSNTEGNNVSK